MSQRVGGVVEAGDASLPGGAYFAQFIGFTRNKDGEIVLKEKAATYKDDNGLDVSRRVTKLYWQFMVVVGPEAGGEVVGSTPYKGVNIVVTDAGPAPKFKAPGSYAPNFIAWLAACGLDFAIDLAEPIFETPLTDQSILASLEHVLLDKAEAGHVVSLKVEETPDGGSWVAWKGGVSAAPPEVAAMRVPGLARRPASGDEQVRKAEYVRYLMDIAKGQDAINVEALEGAVRDLVKEWGVSQQPGVPLLSRLSQEQLAQVTDMVATILMSEGVEFEPWTPAPEPTEADEILGDIPF